MDDAGQRIRALAKSLSSAALRILVELTGRREGTTAQASQRALAESTGLSLSNIQRAIEELTRRKIATTDGGTARRAARFDLHFLTTVELGVPPGPVPKTGTPLHLFQALSAPKTGTPLHLFQALSAPKTGTHPRAREDRSDSTATLIDRLLTATPKNADPEAIAHWRNWLHSYQRKFGREPHRHPPDDGLIAQWMACGEPHQLEKLLYDLMAERKEPGYSYAWFIAVALQRIHGISPAQQQARRAQLKAVPPANPEPPKKAQQAELLPPVPPADLEANLELQRQLIAAAAAKQITRRRSR